LGKHDSHRSTHDFQKHSYSTIVVSALKLAEEIGEWAGRNSDGLPLPQVKVEVNFSFGISGIDKALNHSLRDRLGLSCLHEQAFDPEGAIDASPTIAIQIEDDEKVAGKQRRQHCLKSTCVAPLLEISGKKHTVPLVSELLHRPVLALG
jgi:hypothetical protein